MTKTKRAIGLVAGGALAAALAFAPGFLNVQANAEALISGVTAGVAHHGGGGGSLIAATASVTGLTEQVVRTALEGGQTLAQIAEANGKTADAVIAAARTTYQQKLAQAVTDGKLTQAQADAELAEFDGSASSWMTSTMPGRGGMHGGEGGFGHIGGPKSLIAATASVTGLSEADVLTALRSGQTLAQIADANGKTSTAVIAAARSTLQQSLTAAVSGGTLTQAQADAQLAAFDASAEGWMTSVVQNNHRGPHGPGDQAPQQTPTQAAPTSNS